MAFEVNLGDFNVSNFTATVHEHTNPHVPASVIRTDQEWAVRVRFQTSGGLSHVLTGTWHVGVYIESIGPGMEEEIALLHTPLTPGPGTVSYNVDLVIPANRITVPDHQTQPFKLVTTVSYIQPDGQPGAMAGYIEGPIIQLYNVA
jgi:hypothetical protein